MTRTVTLKPSGGDYSLLSTWESTEGSNTANDGVPHVLEFDTIDITDDVTIDGWVSTRSATNNITIRPATGHEATGPYTGLTLRTSTNYTTLVDIKDDMFVSLDGLTAYASANSTCIKVASNGDPDLATSSIRNCHLIRDNSGSTDNQTQVTFAESNVDNVFVINEKSGTTSKAIYCGSYSTNVLRNVTCIGGATGFSTGTSSATRRTAFINCAAIPDSGNAFDITDNVDATSSNNASDDSTAPGSNPVTGVTTADFVDYAGGNYRPTTSGLLYRAGIYDASVTTDINGSPRSNPPSIGAYAAAYVKTLKASGGDYSLLSTWEATEQALFDAQGNSHELHCDAFVCSDSNVNITGWTTTSSDKTIKIRAADGVSTGVVGAGFVFDASYQYNAALILTIGYCSISGIEVVNTSTAGGTNKVWGVSSPSEGTNVEDCIIRIPNSTSTVAAGHVASRHGVAHTNNLIIGNGFGTGVQIEQYNGGDGSSNITIVNFDVGLGRYANNSGAVSTWSNIACFGNITSDFEISVGNVTLVNCASEDNTATGTGAVTGITTADFVDYDNGNYRPTTSGLLYGAGVYDANATTDIAGNARINPPSIGGYAAAYIKTLKASSGDYSLLSTWESTEQALFDAQGNSHELHCDAFTINDATIVADWSTTSASKTVTVKAAAGAEHGGVWGDGFVLTTTAAYARTLRVDDTAQWFIFDGLEFRNERQTVDHNYGNIYVNSENITLKNLLTRSDLVSGGSVLRNTVTATNCVFQGATQGFNVAGNSTFNFCTVVGVSVGTNVSAGAPTYKNCVAYTGSGDAYSGSANAASTNNASNDLTAPGTSPVTGITTADFVDYAANDYAAAEGGLLDQAGIAVAGLLFDIAGATREDPPSIGAYKAAPAQSGTVTGSGACAAQSATCSGTGTVTPATGTITGSGTPQAQAATASGTGERVVTGSGTTQSQESTSSGTGERVVTGSGTTQSQESTASGAGSVSGLVSGSGSPQADPATASGIGLRLVTGSGSPQSEPATSTGSGLRLVTGSGSPQAQPATSSGLGSVEGAIIGSGSPQSEPATSTGAGAITPAVTGSGSPQSEPSSASGAGLRVITGSGSPQAEPSTSAGSGDVSEDIQGSGAVQAENSTSTGVGLRVITGSGDCVAENSTCAGYDLYRSATHLYGVDKETRVFGVAKEAS